MYKLRFYVALILLFLTSSLLYSQTIRIALFTPRSENDMFWGPFSDFMREAVNDLGMKLTVYYADGNHLTMQKQVQDAVSRSQKPSVLVVPNFKKVGGSIVEIANQAKVPIFITNSPVDEIGEPRERYKYWIGEMIPDDEDAGFVLANLLFDNAPVSADGKIHVIGIEGILADKASSERKRGLERAAQTNSNVVLNQIIPANWESDLAKKKFITLKQTRFQATTVVWTASDGMALGTVQGIKEIGLKPSADVVTGGIDWTQEALSAVKSGELVATIGGHFMEGGWVAVLIYDYFNGRDFASESVRMRSKMHAITKANVSEYQQKLSRANWSKIDFTSFSKKRNPALIKYNFGLDALLQQL